MSLFSRYRPPSYKFQDPERIASSYPSRLHEKLVKERDRIAELRPSWDRLSQESQRANKAHLDLLHDTVTRVGSALSERASETDKIPRHLSKFAEDIYRYSRARRFSGTPMSAAEQRAAARSFGTTTQSTRVNKQSAKASAADGRYYNPVAQSIRNPRTDFGTEAFVRMVARPFLTSRSMFHAPSIAMPCVQRMARREVMFAKKHAGKGHRVPHKRNPNSSIWC
jgi:hypothetical protein